MKPIIHFPRVVSLGLGLLTVSTAFAQFLVNGDFESDPAPASPGYTAISGWMGAGTDSGINPGMNGERPFADNGADLTQVAFLEGGADLGQEISGFTPGVTYTLSFDYNTRAAGNETGTLALLLSLDGNLRLYIGDISPVDPLGSYSTPYPRASMAFVATATTHTFQFAAWATGDRTLLLDNMALVPEPPQYALLVGVGLVGFSLWRRRAAR